MKSKNGLWIALAAGVTVAGLVGFLFATEKGKEMTKKWMKKGEKYAEDLDGVFDKAKEKFSTVKKDVVSEFN